MGVRKHQGTLLGTTPHQSLFHDVRHSGNCGDLNAAHTRHRIGQCTAILSAEDVSQAYKV